MSQSSENMAVGADATRGANADGSETAITNVVPMTAQTTPDEPAPDYGARLIAGKIVGPDGNAVAGSYVPLGDRAVGADKRGRFEIERDGDATIRVSAPGHAPVDVGANSGEWVRIKLEAIEINAVHLSGAQVGDEDQGIGERIKDMAPHVDYICPMIYPSHFTARTFGFDGELNALLFETVRPSLENARTKIPGRDHTLRPWL